jgi:tetratricopeptide (TPR) repeat protein
MQLVNVDGSCIRLPLVPVKGRRWRTPPTSSATDMPYRPFVSPPGRRWPLFLCALLLMQGCALTAPLSASKPREIETANLQQVSVPERSGEDGRALTAGLTSRIRQDRQSQVALARSRWCQRGQALVRKGSDLAGSGHWKEAKAAWEQALAINPSNHAAAYNLALAYASQHDYPRAEEYAIQAINLKHTDLYADGLEQIRRLSTDHQKALQQRRQVDADTDRKRLRPTDPNYSFAAGRRQP